jgi:hypothetical protein
MHITNFMIEELTGALHDRGVEVADRQSLEYMMTELLIQLL